MIAASSNTQALWFLTRGTGFVSLVLLTLSVALGITEVTRWSSPRFPRFVTAALHKNVSLLVVVFLAVHIVTAIADSFAPIGWLDVVVPFHSPYRPLWLGLGTVAFDLLAALTITSLVRDRIGYRTWRGIHWIAYACWPAALLHGLGTGSDTRVGWSLALSLACLAVILFAVWSRLITARGAAVVPRVWTGVGSAVLLVAIVAWTFTGPAEPGWARRAGTPASLLGGRASAADGSSTFPVPFDARLSGTLRRRATDRARAEITIDARFVGGATGTVHLVLDGAALAGGGVQMDSSVATLGPTARPALYRGSVVGLEGTRISARVRDGAGHGLRVVVNVNVDTTTGALTGTLSARASD